MPRTTREQTDQVDAYAELLQSQLDVETTRSTLIRVASLNAVLSFLVSLLALGAGLLLTSSIVALAGVAVCGSLLGALFSVLWTRMRARHLIEHERQVHDRLASIRPEDEPTSPSAPSRSQQTVV